MNVTSFPRARIYLDHNATSPLRQRVRNVMIEAMEFSGNPSSIHTEGRKAQAFIERSREKIAALVGGEANDVIFTSGGTEANMTALSPGLVAKSPEDCANALCFVSQIEHASVRKGGRFSPSQVKTIPVTSSGIVDLQGFIELLDQHELTPLSGGPSKRPFMVSVMLANNETGAIQPVTEIAGIVLERGGLMHCDGVQALGRMPFDLASIGVDLVTIAAHKMGGPKGIGALIGPAVDNIVNDPLISGGGQELGRRGGTEDIVSIAGFAEAAEVSCDELADREMVRFLRDRTERRLRAEHPDLVIFARDTHRLDNTSFMAIPGILAQNMVIALDLDGIAISAGSACSSGKVEQSNCLKAMGFDPEIAKCAFRVSFGPQNWMKDVDRLVNSIAKTVEQHKKARAIS